MNSHSTLLHRTLAIAALGAALVACEPQTDDRSAEAIARAYPERAITLVSWVSPGSPTDLLARALAQVGPRYFGQRITVLNRQGGGGASAMGFLVQQPADGHTLSIMTASGATNIAAGHVPFDVDDFTYLLRIQLDPFLVAVRSESPFTDLRGFFDYAAQNPGELSVSGFGTASAHFLAFARLKSIAGNPEVRWIAYEGSADAAVAALGGHTDAVNSNYSVVGEHVRAGSMRVLGVSSPVSTFPDVASYRDQGYDLAPVHWRGVMGPAGLTPELSTRIRGLLLQTIGDPEFEGFLETSATELGLMESQAAFHQWVVDEVTANRRILRELGLRVGAN
jgi:tripartite-type tricarboxylate transporter receptor subunit TctC